MKSISSSGASGGMRSCTKLRAVFRKPSSRADRSSASTSARLTIAFSRSSSVIVTDKANDVTPSYGLGVESSSALGADGSHFHSISTIPG
jgi:hypothetical protein